MFRIWFDHTQGRFIIQFLRFGMYWVKVRDESDKVRSFGTYQAARDWADGAGLPDAFDEQATKGRPVHVLSHGQGVVHYVQRRG
jgi:hypothetical protein